MARIITILSIAAVAACITTVCASPLNPSSEKDKNADLVEKFVEFLEQDKQLAALLDANAGELVRNRRQATSSTTPKRPGKDEVETVDVFDSGANNEGFFDRAAKFVMEILQRFLKWVNTD